MGANESKQKILNEMLNEVAVNVMNRNSSNATGAITQENSLVLNNLKKSRISGISQLSSSKINVTALQTSTASGSLQSDLTAALTNKIMQETPQLGIANKSEQEVSTIVRNNINAKITQENLQKIAAEVRQKNAILINNAEDSVITNINQSNEAEMIMTLTNDATSKIVTEIATDSTVENDVTQKPSDILGGFGVIFIIIAVVLGGGFLFFQNTATQIMKPKNMMLIGGAVAIVLLLMLVL